MTKTEEIEYMALVVESLGVDSYCGPWLRDQLCAIRCAILDDMSPACAAFGFDEARKESAAIVQRAKDEAAAMLSNTRASCEKLEKQAAKDVDYARRIRAAASSAVEEINAVMF